MKSLSIFVILAALPLSAFAHIEKGAYKGKTSTGADCVMVSNGTTFENGVRHPLNERVQLVLGTDTFTVSHPTVIDTTKAIAAFNHDFFQGVLPTSTGAKALVVTMDHTPGKEGPTSYTYIDHSWKNPTGASVTCTGLQHQQ